MYFLLELILMQFFIFMFQWYSFKGFYIIIFSILYLLKMDFDEDIFLKIEGKWICMKLKVNYFGYIEVFF